MAKCPFCEYEGSSSSVEAHVSGCTDEDHEGKLGSNYRGIIEGTVGEGTAEAAGGDDPVADLPPSLALVAATAVLAIIVLAGSSAPGEPVEDDDQPDGLGEGWA